MTHASKWSAVLVVVGASLVGCEPPKMKPKPVPVMIEAPQTRAQMAQTLVDQNGQFDADVARLPGSSAEEHRQALVALLDRLPMMLKLANGPEESPEFKNWISVIVAAKNTVSSKDVDRRRMEAVENQALQAAAPAFEDIAMRYLYDDTALPPLLTNMDNTISMAAMSVGPMHDLDATNAFVATRTVSDRISADLFDRFPADTVPTTVTPPTPATMPDTGTPTTASAATEPMTPPVTQPTTDATTQPATAPTTDSLVTPATAPAPDATTAPATAPAASP